MDADERAKRRKIDAAAFWPHDARSFAKKLAADHPDAWAVMLAFYDGDKAKVLAQIEQGLHGKFRHLEAVEFAVKLLAAIPEIYDELERQSVDDYWRQRLAEELANMVADDQSHPE